MTDSLGNFTMYENQFVNSFPPIISIQFMMYYIYFLSIQFITSHFFINRKTFKIITKYDIDQLLKRL